MPYFYREKNPVIYIYINIKPSVPISSYIAPVYFCSFDGIPFNTKPENVTERVETVT